MRERSSFEARLFKMKVIAFKILFRMTGIPLEFWIFKRNCMHGIRSHYIFSFVSKIKIIASMIFSS